MKVSELIGRRVRHAREQEGMTQRELGERIGRVRGQSWFPQAVSAAEKGRRDFVAEDLVALGVALRRPITWFFTVSPLEDPEPFDLGGEERVPTKSFLELEQQQNVEDLLSTISRSVWQLRETLRDQGVYEQLLGDVFRRDPPEEAKR